MSVTLHWFLPTTGDSRGILGAGNAVGAHHKRATIEDGNRPPSIEYLAQIARSAEQLGFEGALTPTGSWCEDAWLTTAGIAQVSEKLKFLVAFRPGLITPTLAAQMAATFQRQTKGRLMLNVVTGGDDIEQQRFGDFLSKAERYARCGEFLSIVRGAWEGGFDFDGEYFTVRDARVEDPPEFPRIYFGGSSPEALQIAGEHADVYLTWGEPPAQAAAKLDRVRDAAAQHGRELDFGIRLHVITRPTSEQAWTVAARMIEHVSDAEIAAAQESQKHSQSEGQRRMRELHGGTRDGLEIYPNLWAGVGLLRGGAGTALVGSYEEVADRIAEYSEHGLDEFIFSGYPHLEEAYHLGEGVSPLLRERGLLRASDRAEAVI